MARTKQTARRSTGGKAPRKQLATKVKQYVVFSFFRVSVKASCQKWQGRYHGTMRRFFKSKQNKGKPGKIQFDK